MIDKGMCSLECWYKDEYRRTKTDGDNLRNQLKEMERKLGNLKREVGDKVPKERLAEIHKELLVAEEIKNRDNHIKELQDDVKKARDDVDQMLQRVEKAEKEKNEIKSVHEMNIDAKQKQEQLNELNKRILNGKNDYIKVSHLQQVAYKKLDGINDQMRNMTQQYNVLAERHNSVKESIDIQMKFLKQLTKEVTVAQKKKLQSMLTLYKPKKWYQFWKRKEKVNLNSIDLDFEIQKMQTTGENRGDSNVQEFKEAPQV